MPPVLALLILGTVPANAATKVDPRLAAAKTAYITPARDHDDDRAVAACLVEHLPNATPPLT